MNIRAATPADARAMSRVYVHSWNDTYRGIVPPSYLKAMTVSRYGRVFQYQLLREEVLGFVACDSSSEVFGFITGGFVRGEACVYCSEVFTLYVLKSRRRRGAGSRLVGTLAREFRRIGIHTMHVWVLKRNPNRRFYEKINGIYLGSRRISFAGARLDEVSYGWLDNRMVRLE